MREMHDFLDRVSRMSLKGRRPRNKQVVVANVGENQELGLDPFVHVSQGL